MPMNRARGSPRSSSQSANMSRGTSSAGFSMMAWRNACSDMTCLHDRCRPARGATSFGNAPRRGSVPRSRRGDPRAAPTLSGPTYLSPVADKLSHILPGASSRNRRVGSSGALLRPPVFREGYPLLPSTRARLPAMVPDGQAKWHVLMLTVNNHRLLDAQEASGKYRRASYKTADNSRRNATVLASLGGPGLAQDGAR